MRNYPGLSFDEQFHILRHFSHLDKQYSEELIQNTGVTKQDIREQLALSGSKFFYDFAKNPIELWDHIINHEKFVEYFNRNWITEKLIIELLFDKNTYQKGIGYNAIISFKDLSIEEKSRVELHYRENFAIKRILLNRSIPTWKVCIIIENENEPNLKTIFPGEYAPPLPDKESQTKEEYGVSCNFWNDHVFIEVIN